VAGKMGMPGISIGIEYMIIGRGDNNMSGKDAVVFPTIGMNIPVNRKKYRSMVQEAEYLEIAKESEKTERKNMLESILAEAWKEYNDALRRVALYADQLILAKNALSIIQTGYTTGLHDFEDILKMERSILQYHLDSEGAKVDTHRAISYLNYLMGN